MSEELLPGEVNDPNIGECWGDVLIAIENYVHACASYPIPAKAIVSGIVRFAEEDIEDILDQAREEIQSRSRDR